jgi:phosphatidate cytidylyltransferase
LISARELARPTAKSAKRRANELPLRIYSSIVLGALALAVTWAGGTVFALFWLVAAIGVLWEWAHITSLRPLWFGAGMIYAGIFFVSMLLLRSDPGLGLVALIWLFAMIWTTDIAAYFTGRALGGPKLWPEISPNKTWSGAIGGTIGGLVAGAATLVVAGLSLRPIHALVMLAVVIAAQLGDLMESAIKRRFGVKDSSQLIPGHGGLMDRCDSLVAAAALALLFGLARAGTNAPAEGLLLW